MTLHLMLAASETVRFFTGWKFSGNFTGVDLIAASTNALNGALLARRPDHYKNFTVVGIIAMGLLTGLSGGVTRDLLLGQTPAALTNPAYITLCLVFAALGYSVAYAQGQFFREGAFQFMTAFSLTWFAIVGTQAAVTAHVPVLGCLLIAVISSTAGRWMLDVSSGVVPKQFVRGEWFLATAALTGLVWLVTFAVAGNTWIALGVAFVIGFALRMAALYYGWEEPLAKGPAGVYKHSNGRPLLERKLIGKSKRELRDLGLAVKHGSVVEDSSDAPSQTKGPGQP